MKKNLFFIIIIFALLNTNYARANSEKLDSATNYYLNSNFDSAIIIYNQFINENISSSELYYNLANCYYNTNDIANAIYYYEKALILSPNDKDITHNLQIANAAVQSKVEQIPEFFYISWYKTILNLFNSNSWSYISICLFIATLLSIALFLFSKQIILKKTGFTIACISLILSIISLIFANNQADNIIHNKYAIVFDTCLVKSSPAEDGNNQFEISKGLKVEIIDSVNNWLNIKLEDGKQGWIQSNNVKKL